MNQRPAMNIILPQGIFGGKVEIAWRNSCSWLYFG